MTSPRKMIVLNLIAAFAIGIVGGAVCVLFSHATTLADVTRQNHGWLLYLLPLAGLLVVFLYDHIFADYTLDMGAVFKYSYEQKPISMMLAPLIFLSVCVGYRTGGSLGRAGAALQLGGSVGSVTGRYVYHWLGDGDDSEENTFLISACGMAAAFTAIMNSPLGGALFGVEVLVCRGRQWCILIPSLITSFTTYGIAHLARTSYTDLTADLSGIPDGIDMGILWRVAVLALACTLIGRLYCLSKKYIMKGLQRLCRNVYLRVIVGTLMVIAITKLIGDTDCNGIGFGTVALATGSGEVDYFNFLGKIILTAITLGCGIRGGEIAPNIFIGATFGCTFGHLIGLDPCLAAAVGLIGNLSSVTNCSLAVLFMGFELLAFSPAAVLYFTVAIAITHVLSGVHGLYGDQHSKEIPLKLHIY